MKLVDEYHLTGVELGQFVAWEHKPSGNGEARGEGKGKAEPKRQAGKKVVPSDGSARSPRASSGMVGSRFRAWPLWGTGVVLWAEWCLISQLDLSYNWVIRYCDM